MAADICEGQLDLASFIEVEDQNRRRLFTLTFAEAIDLKGQDPAPPSASRRDHRATKALEARIADF